MRTNYSLLSHNTFGIEATARYFLEYEDVDVLKSELESYLQLDRVQAGSASHPKMLHIGGGSNLLFLQDYDGLVLHSAIKGVQVLEEDEQGVLIRVGAAMVWDDLVDYTIRQGWYGLENLSIIPGEVGAAAVQNIGAYGVEAKDFIHCVHLFDLHTLTASQMDNSEMNYAYRYSILKSEELRGRYAVTHVDFRLSKTFTPRLEYGGLSKATAALEGELTAETLRDVIINMRNSKLPDPKVLGNGGSFFMNPIVSRSKFEQLYRNYPEMPHYEVDAEHVKIPAGWLIEQSGWKGKSLGSAGVYERQALVLVNLGGAKGEDIVRLSDAVRADVKAKFGIDIHPEVNFIF